MTQFNGIFGFPIDGISWNVPEFNPPEAWRQLSDQNEYNPSSSKSSHIRNHALRYIHRVMSLSIFGRGLSTGVVSKPELLFLWAMLNGIQINTGVWFLKHLIHVAKASTGKICVGGMLSVIANEFGGLAVPGLDPVIEGSTLVDMDTLINMRICRHIGGGNFRLIDHDGHIIEPPAANDDEGAGDEEGADDEEAELEDEPQAPAPEEGFHTPVLAPHDLQMNQLLERFDRLEARMTRSEEIQMQMMDMLQRIEDKISR